VKEQAVSILQNAAFSDCHVETVALLGCNVTADRIKEARDTMSNYNINSIQDDVQIFELLGEGVVGPSKCFQHDHIHLHFNVNDMNGYRAQTRRHLIAILESLQRLRVK